MMAHSLFLLFSAVALAVLPVSLAVPYGIPAPNKTQGCGYGVHLEWSTRVGSSIFTAPTIADLMHDGQREVMIPTFSQYIEAVHGASGERVRGYPFIHPKLKSYASPLPVDADGDGKIEWLVAMYTGELVLVNEEGRARGLLKVPPLAVRKQWMSMDKGVGLDSLATVRVSRPPGTGNATLSGFMRAHRITDLYLSPVGDGVEVHTSNDTARSARNKHGDRIYTPPSSVRGRPLGDTGGGASGTRTRAAVERGGAELLEREPDTGNAGEKARGGKAHAEVTSHDYQVEYIEDDMTDFPQYSEYDDTDDYDDVAVGGGGMRPPHKDTVKSERIGPNGQLSAEARASMKLLFHPELYRAKVVYDTETDAFSPQSARNRIVVALNEDEVAVDAHLLSTPRLVSADDRGDVDVILHVSYFFDEKEYQSALLDKPPLPGDVDRDNYVATAVVCVNVFTGDLKWVYVLHLTTRASANPSYGLSSPLVLSGDGKGGAGMQIYVTSTAGSVVGLTGDGKLLEGWPVWLGPMAASASAEDLLGNGETAICVGDLDGKVKCLTTTGSLLWERDVIGGLTDQITFGDVNGDGHVDVVFGTSAGLLYALDGRTGEPLRHFPIVTRGSIVAPVLIIGLEQQLAAWMRLRVSSVRTKHPPLTLVVPSHDGNVYIVNGLTGCIQTVDIDEKSSSMVLADDLTGNGQMDLLVTTISGGVYAFETATPYHPSRAWPSKTKGLNGNSASESNVAVYVVPGYRHPRDVRGDRFRLQIAIEDNRPAVQNPRYDIAVYIGSRTRVFRGVFTEAKVHSIEVRAPLERKYSSVSVVMTLPNGMVLSDTISLSFNMHFVTSIKYLLVIPFLCISGALMLIHKKHEVEVDS